MIQRFLHPKAGTLGADKGVGLFKKSTVMALLYPMVLPPLIFAETISFFYHAAAYGKSPALYLICTSNNVMMSLLDYIIFWNRM